MRELSIAQAQHIAGGEQVWAAYEGLSANNKLCFALNTQNLGQVKLSDYHLCLIDTFDPALQVYAYRGLGTNFNWMVQNGLTEI